MRGASHPGGSADRERLQSAAVDHSAADAASDGVQAGSLVQSSREPRESVFLSAVITCFGQHAPTRHRVRNVSANGACVDRAELLRVGQTVLIDVGTLEEVGAVVKWKRDGCAGLRFAQPIGIDAAKARPKPDHVAQGWRALPRR